MSSAVIATGAFLLNGNLLTDTSEGILLHPTIESEVDEFMTIQGHKIRFVTVNLAGTSAEILARLRSLPQLMPLH